MAVTKEDLCNAVLHSTPRLTATQAKEAVEVVFETLKETLERGESLKISSFGNFTLRDKRPRVGRNPMTGKPIEISARRVVTFRPSPILKDKMNRAKKG